MVNHYLDQLLGGYLHQDYDLFGETIEEVMQEYLRRETPKTIQGLIDGCEALLKINDTEATFYRLYQDDFDPKLWQLTAVEFLNVITAQAKEFLAKTDSGKQ